MSRLTFGTGSVRVEMDSVLEDLVRRATENVAPGLLDRIESVIDEVYVDAYNAWPVKTGRSRAGLERHTTISPDGDRVTGSITDAVPYAYMVKPKSLGGKSAAVELLRKPLRARADELSEDLATAAAKALRGGSGG